MTGFDGVGGAELDRLLFARHRSRIARDATSTRGEKTYSMRRRAPVFSSTVAAMPEVSGSSTPATEIV